MTRQIFVMILLILFVFTGCMTVDKGVYEEQTTEVEFDKQEKIAHDTQLQTSASRTSQKTTQPPRETTQKEKKGMIEEQIKDMSLEEKIGQMVLVGLEGYVPDDHTISMIEDYHVSGFIFFGRNVKNAEQLLSLTNSLKTINSKNSIPIFLSADEEGGRVSRVPEEYTKLPASKVIGDINNPEFSYQVGSLLADSVKVLGLNMNNAPVLDINSNPQNPVIGDRSFGDNVEVVTNLGITTMKGIQEKGVIPVVKHFPGHGDTRVDSHVGLPSVVHSMERLQSFELVPFQEAIDNGADAVMIAHILMTEIDSENPSSLSKAVVTDLLRDVMGFNGVVMTDDLTMGAIRENIEVHEAAIQSVKAGVDIVLVCHGYDNEVAVLNALKRAADNGEITEERINDSVYRILELKSKYQLSDTTIPSVNVEKINRDITYILDKYLKKEQ